MDLADLQQFIHQQLQVAYKVGHDLKEKQLEETIQRGFSQKDEVLVPNQDVYDIPPSMNTLGRKGKLTVPHLNYFQPNNLSVSEVEIDSRLSISQIQITKGKKRRAKRPATFLGRLISEKSNASIKLKIKLKNSSKVEGVLKIKDQLNRSI